MKRLTVSQAADVIGCSVSQVKWLIAQGRLKAKKVEMPGRRWYYLIPYAEACRERDNPRKSRRGYPRGKSKKSKGV